MAQANQAPRIDLQAGLAALEEDLPKVLRVLGVITLEELGWSRPNPLTLMIPMLATHEGKTETFLLRLGFQAYREWPPSAQFVNPGTGNFSYPNDKPHVPVLQSESCRTHVEYDRPKIGGKMQLICCSATLEFYEVLHDVQAHHVWSDKYNFLTTLEAIKRAMSESFHGRFPPHGQ